MGISNRADGAASFLERGRGLAGAGENSGDYPIVLDVCLSFGEKVADVILMALRVIIDSYRLNT